MAVFIQLPGGQRAEREQQRGQGCQTLPGHSCIVALRHVDSKWLERRISNRADSGPWSHQAIDGIALNTPRDNVPLIARA